MPLIPQTMQEHRHVGEVIVVVYDETDGSQHSSLGP